ncbi:MAG: ABC transporter permease [Candidatus Omnitrophica bacterium]|nr:ABC transporter permease [Candidatus Omnitrophota bacterium]HXK95270.1 ABC transporter permease [bacterium]
MNDIFNYMFPGLMMMWMIFIGQNLMADVYTESERKTLPRMLGTPVNLNQFLVSKIIRCVIVCLMAEGLLMLFTAVVFRVRWGNPFWLILVIVAANLSITGLLAVVYGLAKTKILADAITVVVGLLTAFLGGGMIPFDEMPFLMKAIGSWTFNRWSVQGLQAVMNARPLGEITIPVMKLLLFGFVTTGLGMYWMRRRFQAGRLS